MDIEFIFAIAPEAAFTSLTVHLGQKVDHLNNKKLDCESSYKGKRRSKTRIWGRSWKRIHNGLLGVNWWNSRHYENQVGEFTPVNKLEAQIWVCLAPRCVRKSVLENCCALDNNSTVLAVNQTRRNGRLQI
jgi:hypothetical protein